MDPLVVSQVMSMVTDCVIYISAVHIFLYINLRPILTWCMSQAAKKVRAHGIGVHKPEEIEEFGHNDLMVLSDLLGDKPFFFGDAPTSVRMLL